MFKPLIKREDLETLDWDTFNQVSPEICGIGISTLEDELCNIPTIYSYYHGLMVAAKSMLDESMDLMEVEQSNIRQVQRLKGVKVTAVQGEDIVNCNPAIVSFSEIIRNRREVYSMMKGLCDSITMKKDMLIQLSANQRQETKLYSA
jgi:hypothetical protein